MIVNWFHSIISDIILGTLKFGMSVLQAVMITPLNMNSIPGFATLEAWIIGASFVWLAVMALKELFMNSLEGIGDMDVHPLMILKNTIVSAVLIPSSPLILTAIILPLTSFIMGMVDQSVGSPITMSHEILKTINHTSASDLSSASAAGGALAAVVPDATAYISAGADAAFAPEIGFWGGIIILTVMVISILYVAVSSGLRWMELVFLALVGPALALSKANGGSAWDVWVREALATALSQVIQDFSMVMALSFLLNKPSIDSASGTPVATWAFLFVSVGCFIFAFRGPKTLRSILGAQSNGLKGIQAVTSMAAKAAV